MILFPYNNYYGMLTFSPYLHYLIDTFFSRLFVEEDGTRRLVGQLERKVTFSYAVLFIIIISFLWFHSTRIKEVRLTVRKMWL